MKKKIKDSSEIFSAFFNDSKEYLKMFDICQYNDDPFQQKSWGIKLFIFIQMSYETILKSIFIYFILRDDDKKYILNIIEKYSHNIQKLSTDICNSTLVPIEIKNVINRIDRKIYKIPPGLRYTIDVRDFSRANHKLFYETLRSDHWLNKIEKSIRDIISNFNDELDKSPIEDQIIFGDEIDLEDLIKKTHNKYDKK